MFVHGREILCEDFKLFLLYCRNSGLSVKQNYAWLISHIIKVFYADKIIIAQIYLDLDFAVSFSICSSFFSDPCHFVATMWLKFVKWLIPPWRSKCLEWYCPALWLFWNNHHWMRNKVSYIVGKSVMHIKNYRSQPTDSDFGWFAHLFCYQSWSSAD